MSSPAERGGPTPERSSEAVDAVARSTQLSEAILDGVERYGDAFLAYLTLPNVDAASPKVLKHFVDVYAGHYEDRKSFVDAQIEALGWPEALSTFRETEGIWQDDLLWNYDELWRHCLEVYSVNERFGGVHAFFN